MTRPTVTVTVCATLLWSATVLATPTPQQNCDYARITAWGKYVSCVDGVAAKDAKGAGALLQFEAFRKCRHAYFKNWTAFQTKASVAGSTCEGTRLCRGEGLAAADVGGVADHSAGFSVYRTDMQLLVGPVYRWGLRCRQHAVQRLLVRYKQRSLSGLRLERELQAQFLPLPE